MEQNQLLIYLLPTAAVGAIITCLLVACFCCLCSKLKQNRRKTRSVHLKPHCIWEHRKGNSHTNSTSSISRYPPSNAYIYSIYDIQTELEDVDTCINVQDVAVKACKMNGNLLYTNTGQEYTNAPGEDHAEILFIRNNSNPSEITDMWIKNSPCSYCSKELLNYFRGYPKPTIYVGKIWRTGDMNDDNGLIDLMRNGFSIKVWTDLHNKVYGRSNSTAATSSYIKDLRRQI